MSEKHVAISLLGKGSRVRQSEAGSSQQPLTGFSPDSQSVGRSSYEPRPDPSWGTSRSSLNSSEESETGEGVVHCSSSMLASHLRKIAPSIKCDNRRSSVEFPTRKVTRRMGNFNGKSTAEVNEKPKEERNYTKKSKVSKIKDLPEDSNQVLMEGFDDVDDDELKVFPVSMREKRHRKSYYDVPQDSMKQKMTQKCDSTIQVIKKIFQYKPWNEHLKVIESHRGASIVSFFLFVRWLLLMNIIILLLNLFFLVLPHAFSRAMKYRNRKEFSEMSILLKSETDMGFINNYANLYEKTIANSNGNNIDAYNFIENVAHQVFIEHSPNKVNRSQTDIIRFCSKKYLNSLHRNHTSFLSAVQNFLQGTGALESSLLFLGYYPRISVAFLGFVINVPMAFLMLFIVFMVLCLIMMMQYSSYGIIEAFVTKKNFQHLTNDILCAWDYCIQDLKAADLHRQSFYMQIRSNLYEIRQKREIRARTRKTRMKLLAIRLSINVLITAWIACCYFLIIETILFQLQEQRNLRSSGIYSLAVQYIPSVIIILIRKPSMCLFSFLVQYEKYTTQRRVNISIYRNAFLNLSSIVVLIITLKKHVSCEPRDICGAGAGQGCNAPRCWETYVGQQLYKLALSQVLFEIPMALCYTIPRDIIVRKYENKFTKLWGRPVFLLNFEVLWPIHAQTILWLGVFHSPLLPCITILYLTLIFYIQKTIVLNHSAIPSLPFKASRFNATFMNILMIAFVIILISDIYNLISLVPSPGCSPFRKYESMMGALEKTLSNLPLFIVSLWNFIFSGWFMIPAIILECTVLYYNLKHIAFLRSYEKKLKAELFIITQDNQYLLSQVNLTKAPK